MKKRVLSCVLAALMTLSLVPAQAVNAAENEYTAEEHQLFFEQYEQEKEELTEYLRDQNARLSDAEMVAAEEMEVQGDASVYATVAYYYPFTQAGNDVYISVDDFGANILNDIYPCLMTSDGTEVSTLVESRYYYEEEMIYRLQKPSNVAWDNISKIGIRAVSGATVDENVLSYTRSFYAPSTEVFTYAYYAAVDKEIRMNFKAVENGTYKLVMVDSVDDSVLGTWDAVSIQNCYAEVPYDAMATSRYVGLRLYTSAGDEVCSYRLWLESYDLNSYGISSTYCRSAGGTTMPAYVYTYTDATGGTSAISAKIYNSEETLVGECSVPIQNYNGALLKFGKLKALDVYAGMLTVNSTINAGAYSVEYYLNGTKINGAGTEITVLRNGVNYVTYMNDNSWMTGDSSFDFYIRGYFTEDFDPSKLSFEFYDSSDNLISGTQVTYQSMSRNNGGYGTEGTCKVDFAATNAAFADYSSVYCQVYYNGQKLYDAYDIDSEYGKDRFNASTASSSSTSSDEPYLSAGYQSSMIYGMYQDGYTGETITVNFYEPCTTTLKKSTQITLEGYRHYFTGGELYGLDCNTYNSMYDVTFVRPNGECVEYAMSEYLHEYEGLYIKTAGLDNMVVGQGYQMIGCDEAGGALTWYTSNPNVLTVDANGYVKAVAEGEADVYLTSTAHNYNMGERFTVIGRPTGPYVGDVNTELQLFTYDNSTKYISGQIVVVEWVDLNGDGMKESTVPEYAPTMVFASTDGTEQIEVFVTATGTNTYYFDRLLSGGLTPGKEYVFNVTSGNPNNTSEYKTVPVYTGTSSIGNEGMLGSVNGQDIMFKTAATGALVIYGQMLDYIGNVNSLLTDVSNVQSDNGNFVSGHIIITEWVDGVSIVPKTTPTMSFESVDGTEVNEVFMACLDGTNTYYFDRNLSGEMDVNKEYIFKVSLTEPNNLSENKTMVVTTNEMDLKEGTLWETSTQVIKYKTVWADNDNQLRVYAVNK